MSWVVNRKTQVFGVLLLSMVTSAADAADPVYPNELPGFKFHAHAKWGPLQPLVSTQAEADALLGQPNAVYFDGGGGWQYLVHYVGSGGYCDGHPYPMTLVGRVAYIEVVSKRRVSFADIRFPAHFEKSTWHGAHDRVGSWWVYLDAFGLEYQVYDHASPDGSIQAGDLKAIVYGPPRKREAELTGCPRPGDQ